MVFLNLFTQRHPGVFVPWLVPIAHSFNIHLTFCQEKEPKEAQKERNKNKKKTKTYNTRLFAGRHRSDYYSGGHWLINGRSDGIPSTPSAYGRM